MKREKRDDAAVPRFSVNLDVGPPGRGELSPQVPTRSPHAPHDPPPIARPSRRARKDRELPDRRPEGGPGGGGGERHRRRRHAHESVSEEGEEGARRRRPRAQVPRVRQLSRRMAPPPRPQDVDRLAHLSHGVREGRAGRRRGGSRAADREGRAGEEAVVRAKPPRRLRRHPSSNEVIIYLTNAAEKGTIRPYIGRNNHG